MRDYFEQGETGMTLSRKSFLLSLGRLDNLSKGYRNIHKNDLGRKIFHIFEEHEASDWCGAFI